MKKQIKKFDFSTLVGTISKVNKDLQAQTGRAINVSLTLRNWLIGAYIDEYELNGSDRAAYGDKLFIKLSQALQKRKVSNSGHRQLYKYLAFYRTYPQIVPTVSAQFRDLLPPKINSKKVPTVSALFNPSPDKLFNSLSYSHFALLIDIENELKRAFYEIECIRGNWSVRELKRQISTLYYERSGLSQNKEKLAQLIQSGTHKMEQELTIRDPYIFEFLGIKSREIMYESNLEDALLDKLQDFLLELGNGFCFEARQKRILIGNTHGFVDLVFYHRVLKCHILIELKINAFTQENLGQLNTYVSWYKKNIMAADDNPPLGILLCTQKDHTLVEYALAGMDNKLFVSRYQLELPDKEEIQRFLESKLQEMESFSPENQ